MIRWLIAIFIAISVRTPNNPDVDKNDYQLSGGAKGTYYNVEMEAERSDGEYYRNLGLQAKSPNYKDYFLEGSWDYKEAQNINSQNLSAISDISPLYLGTTLSWDRWERPVFLTLVAIRGSLGHIEWRTNFNERYIFSVKLGKEFPVREKVFFEPMLVYKDSSGKKIPSPQQ